MAQFATVADRDAIEAEMQWEARGLPKTMYAFLKATADRTARATRCRSSCCRARPTRPKR